MAQLETRRVVVAENESPRAEHEKPCPAVHLQMAVGLRRRDPLGTSGDAHHRGERQEGGKREATASAKQKRRFQQRRHAGERLLEAAPLDERDCHVASAKAIPDLLRRSSTGITTPYGVTLITPVAPIVASMNECVRKG
jgi:hypothetical protein